MCGQMLKARCRHRETTHHPKAYGETPDFKSNAVAKGEKRKVHVSEFMAYTRMGQRMALRVMPEHAPSTISCFTNG
jgi:hypothetical protein